MSSILVTPTEEQFVSLSVGDGWWGGARAKFPAPDTEEPTASSLASHFFGFSFQLSLRERGLQAVRAHKFVA